MLVYFLTTVLNTAESLLVYDRQTLFDIRSAMENTAIYNVNRGGKYNSPPPPLLRGLPAYLCRTLCSLGRKKRSRRHGKRGGLLVKVKTRMALLPNADPRWILSGLDVD